MSDWTYPEERFLIENYNGALTAREIGEFLGKTRGAVLRKMERLRKPFVPKGRVKGEKHHNAVLTEAQVLEIRSKRAQGATHFSLFEEYPVESVGTISAILARRTWKHI